MGKFARGAVEEESPSVTDDDQEVSLEGGQSEEVDDEIEIIKADIYKYHGEKTYSQEVRDDVFKFQYFDDFEEDVEILEDDEEEEDEGSIDEGDVMNQLEEPKPLLKCKECDDLLAEDDLDGHVTVNHPVPERKEIKQFGGGNFLMLA